MARSYTRQAFDNIRLEESVSVSGGATRHAADSIRLEEGVAVLFRAGPLTVRPAERTAVSVASSERLIVPEMRADLAKNHWDLATLGTGIAAGGVVGRLPGAVVGAVVLYAWGQWRWRSKA